MEHSKCTKCDVIVPPGNEMCEVCATKEQLRVVVDENRRLRKELEEVRDGC